ncbi:MAG: hypothetical protein WDN69_22495 [Aliidongia sp.]
MSTNEVRSDDAARNAGVAGTDMKLEVVVIPVSDVERSKEFYGRIGWRLDIDRSAGEDFRLVQFTPAGSGCSVHFGKNVPRRPLRFSQGIPDRYRHRSARDHLVAAGVEGRRVLPRRPGRPGQRPPFRGVFPAARAPYSVIPTATAGTCRKSRPGTRYVSNVARPSFGSASDLAHALRRAEAAHGEHEKRIGQRDANWTGLVRRLHGG